jgi:hypothetical protein
MNFTIYCPYDKIEAKLLPNFDIKYYENLQNQFNAKKKPIICCSDHQSKKTSFYCSHHLSFLCTKCLELHFEHQGKLKGFKIEETNEYCSMLLNYMKEIEEQLIKNIEFLKSFINKTTTFNSDEFKLGLTNAEIFASKF